ncbi:hypothetical protein CH330_06690 [candidate division WOR-3 bacterium JGI_Cruoil_03_51_56]|uniref:Uncharacterized protein n=1 Tax=candidate division WOR-3 bacterium JGI_Cruoil_03_51_56 TaxID=1973747 RepID=A0A235BSS8_UNCW3|nr:MAG: hypothetical protein CH330_06690 [candidate division WOR-3 bacterium JGI_Cruoil_03_51_56]
MQVTTLKELKKAAKQGEVEILVTSRDLSKKVRTWETIRKVANIVVFIILALAIFAWANPIGWDLLETGSARLARQIMLGVGVVLLFMDYFLPVVRNYKIAGQDKSGLKLVNRKTR